MFQFGIGGMYGNPVGGNLATPSFPQRFGTIQDVSVEFNQKLVPLRGQFKGPDDVAPSDMDVKGKGAFAALEVEIYNALYFGDTITGGLKNIPITNGVDGEAHTMSGTTYTVAHAATFVTDLGVRYAATGGYLQQVTAGNEATGKYSVSGVGVYTFAAGDNAAALLFSYTYTIPAGGTPGTSLVRTLTVINHVQGFGPIFELYLMMPYQGTNGLHLFQCRASKMSAPYKRDNYVISDFEFESYPNAAGNWFEWFQITN
jgi:hypothetical protein